MDNREGKRIHVLMKNLCIIPARGGSKRIPRKNVKSFLGKPMLAYSIETAKQTGLFDEIMVSTDDNEIAEVARNILKQAAPKVMNYANQTLAMIFG